MKITVLVVLVVIAVQASAFSQRLKQINKYALGIEMNAGHSFPAFSLEQQRWKATFYPAGALTVLLMHRMNRDWSSNLGIGLSGYALTNRGSMDTYTLDFASPHILAGIGYSRPNRKKQEAFLKLTAGLQLGFKSAFIDTFENYSVLVEGKNAVYYFLRPELGIRRYFKKNRPGSRFKMGYECGVFYRCNLQDLGRATIVENDFAVTLEPRGNVLGGYFTVLLPVGKEKIKTKEKEAARPPVIYNPRFLK